MQSSSSRNISLLLNIFCSFAAVAVLYFLKQTREKQKEMLIFAVILLPLSYIIAKIIGHFYFDPRPFVLGNFTPLIPHAADNGFPSDHTLFGAAIALFISVSPKNGHFPACFCDIYWLARVLAGVHHVADISGSYSHSRGGLSALGEFFKKGYNIGKEEKTKTKGTKTKTRRTILFCFLLFLMANKLKIKSTKYDTKKIDEE